MKLRMQDNAIRLRLNRKEVEEFARKNRVSAAVNFSGSALRYTLIVAPGCIAISAAFSDGEVVVSVPLETAREWTATDQVGLHAEQSLAAHGSLAIDVEKDFQCMHKGDDTRDPDAYPNPLLAAS